MIVRGVRAPLLQLLLHRLVIAPAAHMHQLKGKRPAAERLDAGLVDGAGAEAAAGHQQHRRVFGRSDRPEAEAPPPFPGRGRQQLTAHGTAREYVFVPLADFETEADASGEGNQGPVGEPHVGIQLDRQRRDAPEEGGEHRRPADVTAAADDDVGLPRPEDAHAVDAALDDGPEEEEDLGRDPPLQPPQLGEIELVTGARHQLRFQTPAGADERDLGAPIRERAGEGQSRNQMAGRSPGRDYHF